MKITVTHDDGTTVDITEGVQITYDVATSSMDWGSGFLDHEEQCALILLAEACRFSDLEEKIGEVWRQRWMGALPKTEFSALNERFRLRDEEIKRRGARWWHDVMPTPEEREGFLNECRRIAEERP